METLRAALIGLGRIGWQFHLPELARHEGFEPAAVVDPLQERLDEARGKYGVAGYRDHRPMLRAVKPDLVVIASPTPFHAEQAIDAFEAGSDVFCDKPLATSLQEADRMIQAAQSRGRKLMAYQPHRGHSVCVALMDVLGRDLIGPVYMVKAASARWRRRNDWQAWRRYGGGMLYNYGAHMIDQLLYITGSRARRVSCSLRTVASLGDADDVVKAVIETDTGVILDMDINQASAWPLPAWCVLGRRGGIVYDPKAKQLHVRYLPEGEMPELELQEGLAAEGRIYQVGEIKDWREEVVPLANHKEIDFYQKCYDYFAMDAEPFVKIEETRELMRVLEECLRSAGQAEGPCGGGESPGRRP